MEELSHILVGTDFSPSARRAVERAARLAAQHDASLQIIHAFGGRFQALLARFGLASTRDGRTPEQRRGLLDAEVQRARAAGVDAVGRLYEASPAAAFEEALETTPADLVVVGASSESPGPSRLLGTIAQRLVKRGVPRMLVCRLTADQDYRRILACVALAPMSERVVRAASLFSDTAEITVFHAYSPPFERKLEFSFTVPLVSGVSREDDAAISQQARAQLSDLLEHLEMPEERLRLLLRRGHPPQALLHAAFMQRCELIVVGRNKRIVAQRLMGDVAKYVLHHASCDVMVINR